MKVALLQCDNVLETLQPRFGNYPEMVEAMFTDAPTPLEFERFDCMRGEYPQDIHAYDFYITTGSKASAFDDLPWVHRLIEFIRLLDAEHKKFIGICFGHQLIALARGGEVERARQGWGIGIAENEVIESPEWMRERVAQLRLLVSHRDQITRLPAGTRVLARSDFCPYFMLQWGEDFLSVQGHPEWQIEYSRALINYRRNQIPAERVETALRSLASQPDNALFMRWVLDFVTA